MPVYLASEVLTSYSSFVRKKEKELQQQVNHRKDSLMPACCDSTNILACNESVCICKALQMKIIGRADIYGPGDRLASPPAEEGTQRRTKKRSRYPNKTVTTVKFARLLHVS